MDNEIRLFACTNCLVKKDTLNWKSDFPRCGYLCNECWITFFKRLKQIHLTK